MIRLFLFKISKIYNLPQTPVVNILLCFFMTQQPDCHMCQNPIIQQRGFEHPRKVADLEVSTAVLRPTYQYFRGYTILFLRQHAIELWDLDPNTRQKFMEDANQVALALSKTFEPLKMNYSLLGNTNPTMDHLHWHLTPRRLRNCSASACPLELTIRIGCTSTMRSTALAFEDRDMATVRRASKKISTACTSRLAPNGAPK